MGPAGKRENSHIDTRVISPVGRCRAGRLVPVKSILSQPAGESDQVHLVPKFTDQQVVLRVPVPEMLAESLPEVDIRQTAPLC